MNDLYKTVLDTVISKTNKAMRTPLHLSPPMKRQMVVLIQRLSDKSYTHIQGGADTQKKSKDCQGVVESILRETGFERLEKEKKGITIREPINELYGWPQTVKHNHVCYVNPSKNGFYYVDQPFGSQRNPDILLLHKDDTQNSVYYLEVKSGAHKWNAHIQYTQDSVLYVSVDKGNIDLHLGRHLRTYEETVHAIVHDELYRSLTAHSNEESKRLGLANQSVARPGHELSTHVYQRIPREERLKDILGLFTS
jgi:hypothetical protein